MKKYILAAAMLFSTFLFAQSTDFSGNWTINKAKTDFGDAPEFLVPKAFLIKQDKIKINTERTVFDAEMVEQTYSEVVLFDGTVSDIIVPFSGARKISSIKWNKDGTRFTLTSTVSKDEQPTSKSTEEWLLENNGKTLLVIRTINQDNDLSATIKVYYDKQ